MNALHRGVITLLRSAITGERLALPEGFSMEEADQLIRSQSLLPLAYQGAYNCGVSMQTQLMQKYQQMYYSILLSNEKQMWEIQKLFQAFEESGIDYLPVKGCNLKALYPRPEMRQMGDADVLIREAQYEAICELLQKSGFAEGVQSCYERAWKKPELYLELHTQLLPSAEKDLCRYFGNGWERAQHSSGHRYDLSVEDAYVFVFTHMTKHFRFCGIGARQLIDIHVYRKAYPEMDAAKIQKAMKQLHLERFHSNILRLLEVWFEGVETDPVTDFITEYVFSEGNWGSGQIQLLSEGVIRAQEHQSDRHSRAHSLMAMLFPSLYLMQMSYNVLYRHPYLYPFFWVVRWFDVLIHKPGRILKRFRQTAAVTDEAVENRRQVLNYMGLDFHYADAEADEDK